jgi:hypothetical protein
MIDELISVCYIAEDFEEDIEETIDGKKLKILSHYHYL